jgi:hypothetical protein
VTQKNDQVIKTYFLMEGSVAVTAAATATTAAATATSAGFSFVDSDHATHPLNIL